MSLVVDASALLWALIAPTHGASTFRRRLIAETCHAPHLIDAEVGHVLRRRVLRGELAAADGQSLLAAASPIVDHRYEMAGPLASAAWSLRTHVTFYDALYAALAQALEVPLLTCDKRLSRAVGLPCEVEVVGFA